MQVKVNCLHTFPLTFHLLPLCCLWGREGGGKGCTVALRVCRLSICGASLGWKMFKKKPAPVLNMYSLNNYLVGIYIAFTWYWLV